jgi:hypothetical protein
LEVRVPFEAGTVVLLGIAVVLGAGACGAHAVCTALCSDSAGGAIDQTSLTAPIVTLSTDPSCSVTQTPADAGGQIFVDMMPKDGPPTSGSCQVHATLADGSTWVAVLSWAPHASECCGTVAQTSSTYPKFTREN